MQLTPQNRAKLKEIIAAGGLQGSDSILRICLEPKNIKDLQVWQSTIPRLGDLIIATAQKVCDHRDVVLFEASVVTIMLFPVPGRDLDMLRVEIIATLSDRLSGTPQVPVSHMWIEALTHESMAQWLGAAAHALRSSESAPPNQAPALSAPKAIGLRPEPALSAAETSPRHEPPKSSFYDDLKLSEDMREFVLQPIVMRRGQLALFVRGFKVGNPLVAPEKYFLPSADLLEWDLAMLRHAAGVSFKQVRQKKKPPRPVFFSVNLNNFRKSDLRQKLMFEMRQVPKLVAQNMHPVMVRRAPGLTEGALVEVAGYLRSAFPAPWLFVTKGTEAATFPWTERSFHMLLDGLYEVDIQRRMKAIQTWEKTATRKNARFAVLSEVLHGERDVAEQTSDVTDTLIGLM